MQYFDESVRVYVPGRNNPKVVCIGGGHGLSAMLRGLKRHTRNITAIVTVADDGGGSGMLREDLGMPPPGDIRNCILALANTEPTMEKLLNYRFCEGSLCGQSFGNLFLAAMNGISETFDEAVHRMGEVLAITGRVLPVTNQNVHLEAEFENGSRVLGESKIYYHKKENDCRITQVRLVPEHPQALPQSLEAIADADMIVMGPGSLYTSIIPNFLVDGIATAGAHNDHIGSLYTSIIPNFLVDGIAEAVAASPACKVLVMNIMTQEGETEGYTGADHVRALLRHGGPNIIDVCVANSTPVPEDVSDAYRVEDAEQLVLCREEIEAMGIQVRCHPLLAMGQRARHDSAALATVLMDVLRNYAVG